MCLAFRDASLTWQWSWERLTVVSWLSGTGRKDDGQGTSFLSFIGCYTESDKMEPNLRNTTL